MEKFSGNIKKNKLFLGLDIRGKEYCQTTPFAQTTDRVKKYEYSEKSP